MHIDRLLAALALVLLLGSGCITPPEPREAQRVFRHESSGISVKIPSGFIAYEPFAAEGAPAGYRVFHLGKIDGAVAHDAFVRVEFTPSDETAAERRRGMRDRLTNLNPVLLIEPFTEGTAGSAAFPTGSYGEGGFASYYHTEIWLPGWTVHSVGEDAEGKILAAAIVASVRQ